jgi:hypothetical protein
VSEADPTEAAKASQPTPAATFLFADIAGFTALTEAHGDEQAAQSSPTSAPRSTRSWARSAAHT